MKIRLIFLLLLSFIILYQFTNYNKDTKKTEQIYQILYDFKEPVQFPFNIDEKTTEIDIKKIDYLHQFSFEYYNSETTQQINYILTRILNKSNNNNYPPRESKEFMLENGTMAYYEERETSQLLRWITHDDFEAKLVYFTNKNSTALGDYKLDVKELLKIANQVQ
ncbi:hypothetical protein [Bacillus sp. SM2101]|uniref:hypothetical protein n=1 Tax=Bacillus sp. SM2101 TaxID=2805366 RepID=UPI001BDDD3DB|nr:hypothetical protein [Bacillus sp. SM2101]